MPYGGGLPTLLQPGFTVPPKSFTKSETKKLLNMTGADFIMNFISDRIPIAKGLDPKIKPKTLGDKVLVIKAETGAGKSAVIPPFLYKNFQDRTCKNIAITQPRVLTTKEIAEGTPENYPFMKMDVNLGFSTGEIKRLPCDKGVIYMTIETILIQLNKLTPIEFMRKYSFILIDEVHDRDINVDMCLYKLKKLLADNFSDVNCPFIFLMSATFNPKIFMEYFGCPAKNFMEFTGMTYPIEPHFAKYDVPMYIDYAVDIAEEIHINNISDITENSPYRDIIIFVAGSGQTKKIIDKLHMFNAKVLSKSLGDAKRYLEDKKKKTGGAEHYYIAPIELSRGSFMLAKKEYQDLFSPFGGIMVPIYKINERGGIDTKNIDRWVTPSRRIIVATRVAETGVTIDTLKYCIDTGFLFAVDFNADFGARTMFSKNITKGMAIQRKGRVGRKSPGEWYPCYTEQTYNKLNTDQFADIVTKETTAIILNIIINETESQIIKVNDLEYGDVKPTERKFIANYLSDSDKLVVKHIKPLNFSTVDLFELPSANTLIYSLEKLYGLGFIDSAYNPTVLGLYAHTFPRASIEIIRMLFAGYAHGANILDLITISAFIIASNRIVFAKKYTPINTLASKVAEKDFEFYYKTIIGDQFVEYILIWEAYMEFLNEMMVKLRRKSTKNTPYYFDIGTIEKWCADRKINYDGIVQVAKIRDELIEHAITAGLNPYYNGLNLEKGKYNLREIILGNLEEGIDEIKKIKKCICDGFRFNLLVWDNECRRYILHHRNVPVMVFRNNLISRMGDDAVQKNANFIIANEIMIGDPMGTGMYSFTANGPLSIMDSINIDLNFLTR